MQRRLVLIALASARLSPELNTPGQARFLQALLSVGIEMTSTPPSVGPRVDPRVGQVIEALMIFVIVAGLEPR